MDHPNRIAEMQGVNRAVSVSPVRQGDLVNAGPHALHGPDAARKPAFCGGRQAVKDGVTSALREILESLPCCLYPVNGPCVSNHRNYGGIFTTTLSNMGCLPPFAPLAKPLSSFPSPVPCSDWQTLFLVPSLQFERSQ